MAFEFQNGIELSIERFEGISQILLDPGALKGLYSIAASKCNLT